MVYPNCRAKIDTKISKFTNSYFLEEIGVILTLWGGPYEFFRFPKGSHSPSDLRFSRILLFFRAEIAF